MTTDLIAQALRLREVHDLSLDGHHREARVAILKVVTALEQASAPAPAQQVEALKAHMDLVEKFMRSTHKSCTAIADMDRLGAAYSKQIEASYRAALASKPPATEQREPLTDEQKTAMWRASTFRGNGGQFDWYCQGIAEAERAHSIGITAARSAEGEV